MNSIFIIGNLTKDPEIRSTSTGKTVTSFTVAVNRAGRDAGEEPEFFRVSAWSTLGENCAKYLAKGRKVCVTGSVSLKTYEKDGKNRSYMEIHALSVEFLTKNEKPVTGQENADFADVSVEDIPF